MGRQIKDLQKWRRRTHSAGTWVMARNRAFRVREGIRRPLHTTRLEKMEPRTRLAT